MSTSDRRAGSLEGFRFPPQDLPRPGPCLSPLRVVLPPRTCCEGSSAKSIFFARSSNTSTGSAARTAIPGNCAEDS
jgi:hypothetical protein